MAAAQANAAAAFLAQGQVLTASILQSRLGQPREEACRGILQALAPLERGVVLAFVERACGESDGAESLPAFAARLVRELDALPPPAAPARWQGYVANLGRPAQPRKPPKPARTPERKEALLLRRLGRLQKERAQAAAARTGSI